MVLALAILLALPSPAVADRIPVRVVGVHDGDTLYVLNAGHRRQRVRLAQIDAPELAQPYGMTARQVLAGLVNGRDVMLERFGVDRYRRPVVEINLAGHDINSEMVATGAAWADPPFVRDPLVTDLEIDARRQRRGLWALPADQIVPPWQWRREHPQQWGAR